MSAQKGKIANLKSKNENDHISLQFREFPVQQCIRFYFCVNLPDHFIYYLHPSAISVYPVLYTYLDMIYVPLWLQVTPKISCKFKHYFMNFSTSSSSSTLALSSINLLVLLLLFIARCCVRLEQFRSMFVQSALFNVAQSNRNKNHRATGRNSERKKKSTLLFMSSANSLIAWKLNALTCECESVYARRTSYVYICDS